MNAITNAAKERMTFHKYWIWIILAIFIAIITANAIAEAEWLYLGALLAPILIYLSLKKPFIFPLGLYVFLLPFDYLLSVTGDFQGAKLTKFLGILTILVLFLSGLYEKKLRWPNKATVYWVLFIIYSLLSICWAIEPAIVSSKFLTAIGLLLLYLIVSSYKINKSEFYTCKWFIVLGGFIAALYMVFEVGFFTTMRTTLTVGERVTDPNVFSFMLLIPISLCIQQILDQKKKIIKVFLSIALSIILYSIILSGSRGGLLGVCVILVTYILHMRKSVILWAILIVTVTISILFVPDFYVERLKTALETGGAGRTEIWHVGWKTLKKYWLIGAGLSNFPIAYSEFQKFTPFLDEIWRMYRAPHNIYLGIFVELGIIGITLLILGMMKHYQILKTFFLHYHSDQVMLKAVFWATLVTSLFLDTLFVKSFWLLWMLILMHKNVVDKEIYTHRQSFSYLIKE